MRSDQECPYGTEDLVYDLWLGSRVHCNGLNNESEDRKKILFDKRCDSSSGSESIFVEALAPIVQNRFQGSRYCGRRSQISYFDLQRPVLNEQENAVQKY